MKKLLLCLLCLCMTVTLFACTSQSTEKVPEGFQSASNSERDGYSLFVPEGWTYYRSGDTNCAYVSNIDRSAVSARTIDTDKSPEQWFSDSASDFTRMFDEMTILEEDKITKISEHQAYTVIYTASYDGKLYGFRQAAVALAEGKLLIITCSANYDIEEPLTESRYASHAVDFANLIAETVISGTPATTAEPSFEGNAPEGMKLACDSVIFGCEFYVPSDWTILDSSGEVTAVAQDKTNVKFSEVLPNQSTVDKYWEYMLGEYKKQFDTVTVTNDDHKADDIGGCPAYLYCVTVTENGIEYKISQYIITKKTGLRTGIYLLTYTVTAENEAAHQAELAKIAGAITFK